MIVVSPHLQLAYHNYRNYRSYKERKLFAKEPKFAKL